MKKVFKKVLFFFACLCAISGIWIYFFPFDQKYNTDECSTVFTSSIYSSYRASLSAFIQAHPSVAKLKKEGPSETAALLTLFESPLNRPANRTDHEIFVRQLRRAIYQSYPQTLNFDSARQSQIEALRSERRSPSPSGKGIPQSPLNFEF